MASKPKSRITMTNRRDGVTTIRATGGYAMAMLAALCGKTPEQLAQELKDNKSKAEQPAESSDKTTG